jgi:hypothetical protein
MDSLNEEFIDSIITNLKIISIIQINEKLCVHKGHLQIDKDNSLQGIKRWFNRDSRDVILNFIKELIRNINYLFNKVKTLDREEQLWIVTRVLCDMDSMENGLNNLKTTYSYDPVTSVTIDNIIIKIREYSTRGRKLLSN